MSPPNEKVALAMGALPAAALGAPPQTVPPSTKEEETKLIAVLQTALKQKMDACRQLGVIGTKDAVPALAALLGDEELSHMARYGLEPIPDASVDEAMRGAIGKLKGRQLAGVIGSIGVRLDAQSVDALLPLLASDDPDVAAATARTLGRLATPKAAEALKARMAEAPAALRAAVADGCLACAEKLIAAGKKGEAASLCEAVAKADVPEYIRKAAQRAVE